LHLASSARDTPPSLDRNGQPAQSCADPTVTVNRASNRRPPERIAFLECLRTAKQSAVKHGLHPNSPPGDMAMSDERRATGEHYREIAEKIRQVARQSDIPQIREDLFDLADRLDQMAQVVENDGCGAAREHLW